MTGIYKITSPSGRIYIGKAVNIEKRWLTYHRIKGVKGQTRLYRSLVKHGVQNHTFEIVEECLFEQLNIRERYWQDYFDVTGENGLNCELTATDVLPKIFSKETILKMSNSATGRILSQETKNKIGSKSLNRKHSEITKKKISENSKGNKNGMYGRISLFLGKNHTEESKNKISRANVGRKRSEESIRKTIENRPSVKDSNNPNSKIVLCQETGIFYYCVKEAAKVYNFNYGTLKKKLSGQYKNNTQLITV